MDISIAAYKRKLGEKIRALRESIGLSQLQVSLATEVSKKTLSNIEAGKGSYGIDHLIALCEFFVLELSELVDVTAAGPPEPQLRRTIISYHQKKGSSAHLVLFEKPTIVYTLTHKLLATEELDEFKEVREIRSYCKEEYGWDYRSSSITNALERLHERDLVEIVPHPRKKNTKVYRKKR